MDFNRKLAVLINVKDRPTELAMLLESLRTQTEQDFDVFILDDCSGTLLTNYHFFNCIVNRIRLENHRVYVQRTEFPHGVSKARQRIVDMAMDIYGYPYLMRVDDDVVLDRDFIEKLFNVIKEGYDLASGITPSMAGAVFRRDPKFIGPIINRMIIDKEGEIIFNGDDCGIDYTDYKILPAHHFRSSALYKSEIHKKVNYVPTKLSAHGFREEQIFSLKCLMEGFKIGVNTIARAWHQQTPSGGERFPQQNDMIKFNQKIFTEWVVSNKDKLYQILPQEPKLNEIELMKETNLLMK